MRARRLGKFLRSVIPTDPYQLVFLLGVACVFISSRLSWTPRGRGDSNSVFGVSAAYDCFTAMRPLLSSGLLLVLLAGLVGYLACFWPGRRPAFRVLVLVCLPALAGLTIFFGIATYCNFPYHSVLTGTDVRARWNWLAGLFAQLPAGTWLCIAGSLLTGWFFVRMLHGKSRLPLSLSSGSVLDANEKNWAGMKRLVYFLIGLAPFSTIIFLPVLALPNGVELLRSPGLPYAMAAIQAMVIVAIGLWLAGRDGLRAASRSLRLPGLRFAMLGLALPAGLACSIPAAHYAYDRIIWAATNGSRVAPPELRNYVGHLDAALLFLILGAFAEELLFRGVLQTGLVARYGTYRGVFLCSAAFAGMHFHTDTYPPCLDGAAIQFLTAFTNRVAVGYLLSWLVLKSESILTSALAHFVINLFAFSRGQDEFAGRLELQVATEVICVIILYCYWPVAKASPPEGHAQFDAEPTA